MRLQQYITEGVSVKYDDIYDIIPLIKRDCKKWINESNGQFAFRGMKNKPLFIKHDVRKNRKPKDTSKSQHELMDNVMNDKFGWHPRSEGLFCSGDMMSTTDYGVPYMIFPIGDYRYVWNPKVKDSFLDTSNFSSWWVQLLSIAIEDKFLNKFIMEKSTKKMLKGYIDTGLSNALRRDNEVMVECKEYYAIRAESIHSVYNDDAPYASFTDFLVDIS